MANLHVFLCRGRSRTNCHVAYIVKSCWGFTMQLLQGILYFLHFQVRSDEWSGPRWWPDACGCVALAATCRSKAPQCGSMAKWLKLLAKFVYIGSGPHMWINWWLKILDNSYFGSIGGGACLIMPTVNDWVEPMSELGEGSESSDFVLAKRPSLEESRYSELSDDT